MPLSVAKRKQLTAIVEYFLLKKECWELEVTLRRLVSQIQLVEQCLARSTIDEQAQFQAELASLQSEHAAQKDALLIKKSEVELKYTQVDLSGIKAPVALHLFPSYSDYARTARKIPNDELYDEYLLAVQEMLEKGTKLTQSQVKYVEARQIWTDVIACTDDHNEQKSAKQHIPAQVIKRLESLGYPDAINLYEQCKLFVQQKSRVTVSFGGFDFLKNQKKLTSYQLLNLFEVNPDLKGRAYMRARDETEKRLFDFLPNTLKQKFISNLHARPHYGALKFTDRGIMQTSSTHWYGQSFIIFKEVVKLNSLFVPMDSMYPELFDVCTYHHPEFILLGCDQQALRDLVSRVNGQKLGSDYFDNAHYFEVMLPPVNILDPNLIEEICLDLSTYTLSPEEKSFFEQLGIKITNTAHPQFQLPIEIAIREGNVIEVVRLLNLDSGYDIYSLLMLAMQRKNKVIVDCIYAKSSNCLGDILALAIQYNAIDIFTPYLQKEGYLIDKADSTGQTLLMQAAALGRVDMVTQLLTKGANIALKNCQNQTVLDLAIKKHPKLLETCLVHLASLKNAPVDASLTQRIIRQKKKIYKLLTNQGAIDGLCVVLLLELQQKRDAFPKNSERFVAADTLLKTLRASYDAYQEQCQTTPEQKQDYLNQMRDAWQVALSQVCENSPLIKHRTFKYYVAHLMLFLLTGGVGSLAAAGYTLYQSKGTQLFFKVNTDSMNIIQSFNDALLKTRGKSN